MLRFIPILLLTLSAPLLWSPVAHAEFALRDGDTVAFLGDSNTEWGTYAKVIESYTRLRFPSRQIRVLNAGVAGSTAIQSVWRLQTQAIDRGANVVVITFGINDFYWGNDESDNAIHWFTSAIQQMLTTCQAKGIRCYVLSYPVTEAPSAKALNDNRTLEAHVAEITNGEQSFLQVMGDQVMAMAEKMGGHGIDAERTMRKILSQIPKNPNGNPVIHQEDGVHLNDIGNMALAYSILKGLGAPELVSSVDLSYDPSANAAPLLLSAQGAQVPQDQIKQLGNKIEFQRLDEGLPIVFNLFAQDKEVQGSQWIPFTQDLDRYMLRVRNLPSGNYVVKIDNEVIGPESGIASTDLEAGVNLTAIASNSANVWTPNGPWDWKSMAVSLAADAKRNMEKLRLYLSYYYVNTPADAPAKTALDAANVALENLEKALAQPYSLHFSIEKVSAK